MNMDISDWRSMSPDQRESWCRRLAERIPGAGFDGLEGGAGKDCAGKDCAGFTVCSRKLMLVPAQTVVCGWVEGPLLLTSEQRSRWVDEMSSFWGDQRTPEETFAELVTRPRSIRLETLLVEVQARPAQEVADELMDQDQASDPESDINPLKLVADHPGPPDHSLLPGFRLPSADEWEALYRAGAASVFPWGDQWPEGMPYKGKTEFTGHLGANAWGLRFNPDPYVTEIVAKGELRGGDGGCSLCGGMPVPYVWHTLACAYRPPADLWEDLCFESLETSELRLVLEARSVFDETKG